MGGGPEHILCLLPMQKTAAIDTAISHLQTRFPSVKVTYRTVTWGLSIEDSSKQVPKGMSLTNTACLPHIRKTFALTSLLSSKRPLERHNNPSNPPRPPSHSNLLPTPRPHPTLLSRQQPNRRLTHLQRHRHPHCHGLGGSRASDR